MTRPLWCPVNHLTVAQLASWAGTTSGVISHAITSGHIDATKPDGYHWVISLAEARRYLETRRRHKGHERG